MNLRKCILTENDCYKSGRRIKPKGVMVHSTGANNPNLKRYIQPDDGFLGKNNNNNHWNRSGVEKCVHAFIGRGEDGKVYTYQTLPFDRRGWHAGGEANNSHISFEICEDDLKNTEYFNAVYKEAVEFTAYLCKEYGLDPESDGVVICHSEGYERGIASRHSDVMHWFPKHGKDMDDFRTDVKAEMNKTGESEDVERYNIIDEVPVWGKATVQKLMDKGYLLGGDAGLGLTEDMLRLLVINDRAGVYGN